ncbi:uncharacterized protein LOC108444105 isoform X6 [Pygocentrus nattereri]|uniref:uncharacterized protein LOC108444105 isoform X6 n=1 Tax=Pygocentrus nattereri TaxID=42514 RepID=UPI001891DE9A|nr:uncharacterized protein LOC108444105 isoform X6 [Pygocentrus nattereri]
MKNLLLQIRLLIWFESVEGLRFVQVELGKNITVNCDLADTTSRAKVYWYLQTHGSAPVVILRTFNDGTETEAQNIKEDELGDYYCVKAGEPFFTNGARLHITVSGHQPPPHTPWPGLTLASALLNCVFTAAITALLCKRSPKRRQSPESNLQQHHNGMQEL